MAKEPKNAPVDQTKEPKAAPVWHKIDKTFVDQAKEPGCYRDRELRGFCLKVTARTANDTEQPTDERETANKVAQVRKVYIVHAKIRGTRKLVTVTIGEHGKASAYLQPGDGGSLTVSLARKAALSILSQLAKGENPNELRREQIAAAQSRSDARRHRDSITLSSVLDDYIKSKKKLKRSTVYIYRCVVNSSLKDWLDLPIAGITKDMIEDRHGQISEKHKGQADHAMRIVRALFTYAMDNYEGQDGRPIIVSNPVRRLTHNESWNKLDRRESYLKPDTELPAWFNAVKTLPATVRDYLMFLLFTGLRTSEAAQLKWKDVDLRSDIKTITIRDTKNGKAHVLPLSDSLINLLAKRKDSASLYVFPGERKSPHIGDIRHYVNRICEESKVHFILHDLRRSFLTYAEALDISHYALKRLANHKMKTDVTAGYIGADAGRLLEPMQRITNYILEHSVRETDDSASNVVALRSRA